MRIQAACYIINLMNARFDQRGQEDRNADIVEKEEALNKH